MNLFASDSPGPYFRYAVIVMSLIWLALTFWFFFYPGLVAIIFLNAPGDLRSKERGVFGIPIPGKLRVIIEISVITLGLLASLYFGLMIAIIQLLLTIAYLRFDSPRISWLWGWATYPPTYVKQMYSKE